jgi:hypothetical protein
MHIITAFKKKKNIILFMLWAASFLFTFSCYHAWNLKKPKGKMAIFFTTTLSFKIKTRQRQ